MPISTKISTGTCFKSADRDSTWDMIYFELPGKVIPSKFKELDYDIKR